MYTDVQRLIPLIPYRTYRDAGMKGLGAIARLLGHNWCRPMTLAGKCTEDCSNCKIYMLRALQIDTKTAKSPTAIFIYNLRNEFAKLSEADTIRKVDVSRDHLDEPIKGDVWDQIGAEL